MLRVELVLDSFADDEHLAIELDATGARWIVEEQLLARRHRRPCGGAERVRTDRHITPPEDPETFVGHDRLDRGTRLLGVERRRRQERQTHGVVARLRQGEWSDLGEEAVRDLDQDPGAVAGVGLGTGCPTVLHVAQRSKPERDDLAAGASLDVGDERDTAGIMFETRVVQTSGRGRTRVELVHRILLPRSRGRRDRWIG